MAYHDRECERRGLVAKTFVAKRGEVFVWHSALLHGGAPVADQRLTRKSFVVHYSSLRTHRKRSTAIEDFIEQPDGNKARAEVVWSTERVIIRDGAQGFDNPLDGYLDYVRRKL